jgi:predicted phage-related endonuclease
MLLMDTGNCNIAMHANMDKCLYNIEDRVIVLQANQYCLFDKVNNKIDDLLQKMNATWTKNTALHEAYYTSREETAALKMAIDALTKKLDDNIAIMVPPLPETVTSSNAIDEIMMQLSHMQYVI